MRVTTSNVITIKEARKILGHKAEMLSDDQVTELIDTLHLLAQYGINSSGSKYEQ